MTTRRQPNKLPAPGWRLLLYLVLLAMPFFAARTLSAMLPGNWLVMLLADAGEFLARPFFTIGQTSVSPAFFLRSTFFLLLILLISRASSAFLRDRVLARLQLSEGQRFAIERVFGYAVFVLGMTVGLETLGIDFKSLAFIGGAVGIGVGLGLQNIANNFISGLVLLVEQPIQVGDRIEIGGLAGDVVRIAARSTWIRTNDNIIIVVPNDDIINNQVINWTANDAEVRVGVKCGVAYESDPAKVRDILLQTASRHPDVLAQPAPLVLFQEFGESSLDFELLVWTNSRTHSPGLLRSDLRFAIFAAFLKAGIEIPFPQRDVRLRPPATADASGLTRPA